jgi:toxin YoeB
VVDATLRDVFTGRGKPQDLTHFRENVWSRRINDADRLVYVVLEDRVEFLQARTTTV